MSAKWWCVDCFLEVGHILQESASPMRSELLLWHGPCSEATAAPYFSIRVISWRLFFCCPKLCSAFCPAIQVFLSNVSWICIFLVLYINWCQTLLVCIFTWRNKKRGCLCKQESVGASEHPPRRVRGALPLLLSKLLMEMSRMPSVFNVLLVQNSAVYLSLKTTLVFCEIM